MRLRTLSASLAVALTTFIGAGNLAVADVLRVGGTGSMTAVLNQIGAHSPMPII